MKQFLERFRVLKPGESGAVLASLATLFCTFSSYTMLRPVREAFGVTSGLDKLWYLYWGVLVVMLLLQPLYGWLTSRFARSVFLPWVYAFFIVNLLAFWLWFHLQTDHTWIARTYYMWVGIFNLFVVANFWGLMADMFTQEQAGRLFGFIWAGASAGGLIGPLLDQLLVGPLGAVNLLLVSAGLLLLALVLMMRLIRRRQVAGSVSAGTPRAESALGGGVLAAFWQVVRSPYLLGIALFVLCMTWVSTFLYFEQQHFVKDAFSNADQRTHFFAGIDLAVQFATLLLQALLFGRLFRAFGMRALLAAVPLLMIGGYTLIALAPGFVLLNWVYGVRRVTDYGLTRPCRDSLFTVVTRQEKYQAKTLIDTFVYRLGDATSATLYTALSVGLGVTTVGIGWLGAAVAAVWLVLALALGRAFQQRAQAAPRV
jgi:AAA family ATP:ADP antiporter